MTNRPANPESSLDQHAADPLESGLYLVATPIGNLEDITLRALRILRSADRIACEDTRQTQKLLNHFAIQTPTVSCHLHNEHTRAGELVQEMLAGQRIALVSDAGLPAISDPGSELVRAALQAGLRVTPIPGANAALTALIASGLPTEEFLFLGFLPEKAGARRTRLEALAAEPRSTARTLLLYEAPHRIEETLADLESVFGPALRLCLARELTKIHEEFLRLSVTEARQALAKLDRVRGEFVLLVELAARQPGEAATETHETLSARLARLQAEAGLDEKEALKRLARQLGQSKSELYRELQRERSRLR